MTTQYQIASEIKDIKLSLAGIEERSTRFEFQSGSGSEKTQVVGFESPTNELVSLLVGGANERTWVSVVGMGGLGKTTLAKHVFDNQLVKSHFDCCSFITVSQSYTMTELLIDVIKSSCMNNNETIPKGLRKMDDKTLITRVRQYLESKRYLVLFDDVWEENFSDEIEHALISNNEGSRIIVTTRKMNVAEYFKKSFPVHIHELQPLIPNKAWELFCNKGYDLQLWPLVVFCSTKAKTLFEWRKVSQNLRMELERNVHLTSIIRILCLSYDDLPYHLKSCMLYFGNPAEGFVKNEHTRPFEEVAEEYLIELVQRSLVQVSKLGFDGKVKRCQVHDLLCEMVIKKMKDFSFCHSVHEGDELVTVGITRRLSIVAISNNMLRRNGNSGIRAVLVFDKGEFPKRFMDGLSSKFNSIGNLINLETLDLWHTKVTELPREINMLTKRRLLPVYNRKHEGHYSILNFTTGVKMQEGIGCLKSLQKLYFLEVGIRCMRREYGNALCAAIQEMKHLESQNITAIVKEEILDLDFISTPPDLIVLNLKGRLTKLPDWTPNLKYLVKLRPGLSNLVSDPLDSLKNFLHFHVEGFPKLRELDLTRLNKLSSITIDNGALLCLEHLKFNNNPKLKVVPQDLKHLKNLQFLGFADMPHELVESIDPAKDGKCHWIINHIPRVLIRQKVGLGFYNMTCTVFLLHPMSESSRFKFFMLLLKRRCTLSLYSFVSLFLPWCA
ncbi:NB-ARC domain disease resistance protein [Medicago truncatula]|uniref:NB-ARC domain disease resistance protein n=1 Tax=Medicago truncatula TaxID=3880 RepID=G7IYM6_MEDTR|nr:NB-ARC domain disease resistance protein [Medicago truncatula]